MSDDLAEKLESAPPMPESHQELSLELAAATPGTPATPSAFRVLLSKTGGTFIALARFIIAHPAAFAAVVTEAATGQYGKALDDAVALYREWASGGS